MNIHQNKKMKVQGNFRNDNKDGKWIYYEAEGKGNKNRNL